MKKLLNKFVLLAILLIAGFTNAQTIAPAITEPSWQTPTGVNFVYTIAMTDSTGTFYSPSLSITGFNPKATISNAISAHSIPIVIIGTGTADSVEIFVQARMRKTKNTWSTWRTVDTVTTTFNKVDDCAYAGTTIDFNGLFPDQMRFVVAGASAVNRSDVVITVIAVLTKPLVLDIQ